VSKAITHNASRPSKATFVTYTLIASTVAAIAAASTAGLDLEVWAMFAGFIAWFTRPTSTSAGAHAVLCLWLGLVLGAACGSVTDNLAQQFGSFPIALAISTFGVAIIVVGLRTTAVVDNMLGWFLGLVTWFAADLQPGPAAFVDLGVATAIGGVAGWACQALNRRYAPD
jgi:hypothetical protein